MPRVPAILRILPWALAALLLAACGNKGPLVKPSEAPAPTSDVAS